VERLMTARELAEKVGWHPATVHNRRHAGLSMPPAIKLGNGTLRFREEDVEAWLDSQVEQPEQLDRPVGA
jgi:predicted DNA-binding transcriptional regulator AlpA